MKIKKRTIRSLLLAVFLLTVFSAPVFAIRYVCVSSVNNVPLINIRDIEDFKLIIAEYHLSMVYRTSTQLIAIADGTYFSFTTGAYDTIEDYETGISKGFKNGTDFYASQKLGIDASDFYYWYSSNSFSSVEDARDAYKNGFFFTSLSNGETSSKSYYAAKRLGYTIYKDYQDYLNYTKLGYKTKDEWEAAQKAGFHKADEYNTAVQAGFTTFAEYNEAKKIGIEKKESYDSYKTMTDSITKVVEKDKLTRAEAFVLVLLQDFPKGDLSTAVLSSRLTDILRQKSDITKALSAFVFGTNTNDYNNRNSYNNRSQSLSSLISESGLRSFFTTVDLGKSGSYDQASDVFKKR